MAKTSRRFSRFPLSPGSGCLTHRRRVNPHLPSGLERRTLNLLIFALFYQNSRAYRRKKGRVVTRRI